MAARLGVGIVSVRRFHVFSCCHHTHVARPAVRPYHPGLHTTRRLATIHVVYLMLWMEISANHAAGPKITSPSIYCL